jgi:hypothetical protein
MTLATTYTKTLSALTVTLCLVPLLWGQSTVAPKQATKVPPAATAPRVVSTRPASGASETASSPSVERSAPLVAKRDPFSPLITERKQSAAEHLPPGKAGLVVATVRVNGTVRSGDGMIAVVSNPDEHVYFVREGDKLYDGDVDKISLEGVTFRENSKDAFGKPVERVVTKRIYASAGAQQ